MVCFRLKQSCKHVQGFSEIALRCLCPLLATCRAHDSKIDCITQEIPVSQMGRRIQAFK